MEQLIVFIKALSFLAGLGLAFSAVMAASTLEATFLGCMALLCLLITVLPT